MKLRHAATVALLAALLAQAPASAQVTMRGRDWVRFQTWGPDSLALFASFFGAPAGEAPVALFLHDRGAQGSGYYALARAFQAEGMPAIVPDLRGEGESVLARGGYSPPREAWTAAWRRLMTADVAALVDFAERQPSLPGRPWVLVADGEACPLALELLAADTRFAAAALLSPFVGADLDSAALSVAKPVFLLACDQDASAVAELRGLYSVLPASSRHMEIMPCRSRGASMLKWVDGLGERIARWCLETGGGER